MITLPLSDKLVKQHREEMIGGLPISAEIVSITQAAELFQKTFRTISLLRAEFPAAKESHAVTWWIIGSMIVLDKASLIEVALSRGWIEERGEVN